MTASASVFSQPNDSLDAPYKRFKGFPPVKLLLPDSTHYFTKYDLEKKSSVMLMIFNPECDHCKHETEEIISHIEDFKGVQIVMATFMPFDSMMNFQKKYNLDKYENIVVGQDFNWLLPSYFKISTLPFLAFYDRKKEIISVFEGSLPIERVIAIFKG